MLIPLALLLLSSSGGDPLLENGDFEARAKGDSPIPGWSISIGARNGAEKPTSTLELDAKVKHGGKTSLHFSGDEQTRGWKILKQGLPVRPEGEYSLEAMLRTEGIRPNGFGLDNCYFGLLFFDAEDKLVGRDFKTPARDQPWLRMSVHLTAPPSVRRAEVYIFLSMIGDLWVDEVQLEIKGGQELAQPERIFFEDFEKLRRLPSSWKRIEGATNGEGGTDSIVGIDEGALGLSGDAGTSTWWMVGPELKAKPGGLFELKAKVKAKGVEREGAQFQNLHLSLAFLDRRGNPIGTTRFGSPGQGSFDWKDVSVSAVSPEGTRKVRAGMFLSMSGEAWFDDIELLRLEDVPIPYGDWETIKAKGVTLRFSPSHPQAKEMRQYSKRLASSKDYICSSLGVEFDETITVLVYRDLAEGKQLTGGTLDFADPEGRRVHQRMNSFISHEMTHVIAHNQLTYSGTALLGEGIAVWLNGQSSEAHHRKAWTLLQAGELPSLQALLNEFRQQDAGYPAAGSLCGFLIETHGLELFKRVYPLKDPFEVIQDASGQSQAEMESAWHAYLEKYR